MTIGDDEATDGPPVLAAPKLPVPEADLAEEESFRRAARDA